MLLGTALVIGLALPASAQMMGGMGQGDAMDGTGGGMMGMGGGMMGMMGGHGTGPGMPEGHGGRSLSHEGPLISIMLNHRQELDLNAEQVRKLQSLRTEFEKESVRRTAEIRVAEIDLGSLLEQDKWDLAKIEPKVKQIAGMQADLRLARMRSLEAGRAVLSTEQLEKFKQLGHRMRAMGGPGPGGSGRMGPGQQMGPGHMGPGMPPGPGGPPAPRQ
jgi:Spy/CpxP family protein refolding chaperone